MPRQKSFKTVCVDSVLFFALFALAGHLTINFWERYAIQNELSSMKNSLSNLRVSFSPKRNVNGESFCLNTLNTLQNTITNIGNAYDNLHTELTDLIDVVDPSPGTVVIPSHNYKKLKDPEAKRCKNKPYLNRRDPRDIQVQALITKRNDKKRVGVGTLTDADLVASKTKTISLRNKSTTPMAKNIATNTKNPVTSTGITSDLSNSDTAKYYHKCNHSICHHHSHIKSHKDLENSRNVMY